MTRQKMPVATLGRIEQEIHQPVFGAEVNIFGNKPRKGFKLRVDTVHAVDCFAIKIQYYAVLHCFNIVVAGPLREETIVVAHKVVFEEEEGSLFYPIHEVVLTERPAYDQPHLLRYLPFLHQIRAFFNCFSENMRLERCPFVIGDLDGLGHDLAEQFFHGWAIILGKSSQMLAFGGLI